MYLKKLKIANFRNIREAELNADVGFNLVLGENAQGKSNLMEALYSLSLGRSYKTSREEDLINFKERFARIEGLFTDTDGDFSLEILWEKRDKQSPRKTIKFNANTISRLSDFLGRAPMVLFLPDDLEIIRGAPHERRKYLDLLCSRIYPPHVSILREYRNIVNSRNCWLKIPPGKRDPRLGEVYLERLSTLGSRIIHRRLTTLEHLKAMMKRIYEDIFHMPMPGMAYRSSVKDIKGKDPEGIRDAFESTMKELACREEKYCCTLAGPHRDDFMVKKEGKPLKSFGSMGEIRSFSVVMKLAEVGVISNLTNREPLLLIDDSLQEFDPHRTDFFLEYIRDRKQVFYGGTKTEDFFEKLDGKKLFTMTEGVLEECSR